MSKFTAYGTADNIPSNWPAGLKYNPSEAKYVFSVNNAYQIAALDHVHVVDIDVPQSPPGNPNTMSLTLPIMKNLPLESRMYFFYSSQSTEGDLLQFLPVTGSGNTVNGNALGYTFVLTGQPELFIALGVRDNYIIHVFGQNNSNEEVDVPMVRFDLDSEVGPVYNTPFGTSTFVNSEDLFPGSGAFGAEVDIIAGMEGYLVPDSAVPTQGFEGFLCTVSGVYAIDPVIHAEQSYVSGALAPAETLGGYWANIYEFDSAGAFLQVTHSPAYIPFTPVANPGTNVITMMLNTTFYSTLLSGNYYVFSFSWDLNGGSVPVSGDGSGIIDGSVTFQYWAPVPPPSGPSSFLALAPSASVRAANVDPAVFSRASNPMSTTAASLIQKSRQAASAQRARGNGGAGSDPLQGGVPSFSLSDFEKMITQALDARERKQQQSGSSSSSSGAVVFSSSNSLLSSSSVGSSSSSSSSSGRGVAAGKRAASSSGGSPSDAKKRKVG